MEAAVFWAAGFFSAVFFSAVFFVVVFLAAGFFSAAVFFAAGFSSGSAAVSPLSPSVAGAALTPVLPGAEMIGASSDHLIVDVEDCGGQVRVGDWMEFRCGYMAVLDATTSAYVDIVVK